MRLINLKTTIRQLLSQKTHNLINIFGLAISLATIILLVTYSVNELGVDSNFSNREDIFVVGSQSFLDTSKIMLGSSVLLADEISSAVPEFQHVCKTYSNSFGKLPVLQFKDNDPLYSEIMYAEPSFFEILEYEVLFGDLTKALDAPMSMVLTSGEAKRFFGESNPIGKTIKLNNKHTLTVKAVIKEPTVKTTTKFNAVVSFSSLKQISPWVLDPTWTSLNVNTFVSLKPGSNVKEVENKVNATIPPDIKSSVTLFPYTGIYFSSTIDKTHLAGFQFGNIKRIKYILLFSVLIIILALANFINLNISQISKKSQQICLRKLNGASWKNLFGVILVESTTLYILSIILALIITSLFYPTFIELTGLYFSWENLFSNQILIIFLILSICSIVILGIVPTFIFSRLKPSRVLTSVKSELPSAGKLRNALLIFQFVIAICITSFTLLMQKQIKYGFDNPVFSKPNVVWVELTPQLKANILQNELASVSNISAITSSQFNPGKEPSRWQLDINNNGEKQTVSFNIFRCAFNYPDFFNLELIDGTLFNQSKTEAGNEIIVNETFIKQYGIKDFRDVSIPIGFRKKVNCNIVGVVKDFHYKSLTKSIEPLILHNQAYKSHAFLKLSTTNFEQLNSNLKQLKQRFKKLSPDYPVEIGFLDDSVELMYSSELSFQKSFTIYSVIAILLAGSGIFAIAVFNSQNRIKEIGIRKVNGAKVTEILSMLNKDFVKWVAIAFILACPIAYYAMNKWLENFAYKTTLSWWIFALAGLLVMGIALLTVSFQSYKAATRNPVEALRYE